MNDEIKSTKLTNKNRITLTEECVNRLHHWETQIGECFKGMAIKPAELVEWVILSHSENLTPDELQDVQTKYWDDIAMASWALRELKKAKASGEALSLQEVLSLNGVAATKVAPISKRKAEVGLLNQESLAKEKSDAKAGG
jgi:hypothetical protein